MEELIFDIRNVIEKFFNKKNITKKILYVIIFYFWAFLVLSLSNYVIGKNVLDFSNFDVGVLIIIPPLISIIAYNFSND